MQLVLMSSVRDITAEDLADTDPVTVNVGQPLSKVYPKMEDAAVRALAVVDGSRFEGMVSYRDVMEKLRSDPAKMKVDPLMHTPPRIEPDATLPELANLRIDSGRKTFALLDGKKLAGVIGEREIVFAARDTEELEGVKVHDVMTAEPVTVEEDTSLETARKRMSEENISRLVVVDDQGELSGVISTLDTLRAMVTRDQMSSGTGSASRRGTPTSASGDRKGEKGSLSDVPVREMMQTTDEIDAAIIEDGDATLRDAIDIMERTGALEIVPVDGRTPEGILTMVDIVNYIASTEMVESLLVQLTGPEVPEEKAAIHTKIENAVRGGLGRVLDRPEELRVHMKKYEEDGTQHKYSLNFKLSSELGMTHVNTHGWELLDAVDEGLEKLQRIVKDKKGKMRDQQRDRERKGKYSR